MSILSGKNGALLAVGLVGVVVVYLYGKKLLGGAAGLATGNNAITAGTPYAGAGALGTLGAATNDVSGGVLQSWGESIGSSLFDLFNPTSQQSTAVAQGTQAANRDQVVTPNYISDIAGAIGGAVDTSGSQQSGYNFGMDSAEAASWS